MMIHFFKPITYLPRKLQIALGRFLGYLFYWFMGTRRKHNILVNLKQSFPQMTPEEYEQLIVSTLHNTGIAMIDTLTAWSASDRAIEKLYSISGEEHINSSVIAGHGVILICPHMQSLELGCRILAKNFPVHVLYKPFKNKTMDHFTRTVRSKTAKGLIKNKHMKQMIKVLRAKEIVCYAPDQDYGKKHSVMAPFFGVETNTVTATAKLAQLTGAKVLPVSMHLQNNGTYSISIQPEIPEFPGECEVENAAKVNRALEKSIAPYFEQYMWFHRRFKVQPDGHPVHYIAKRYLKKQKLKPHHMFYHALDDWFELNGSLPFKARLQVKPHYHLQVFPISDSRQESDANTLSDFYTKVEKLKLAFIPTLNIRKLFYSTTHKVELARIEPIHGQLLSQSLFNGEQAAQFNPKVANNVAAVLGQLTQMGLFVKNDFLSQWSVMKDEQVGIHDPSTLFLDKQPSMLFSRTKYLLSLMRNFDIFMQCMKQGNIMLSIVEVEQLLKSYFSGLIASDVKRHKYFRSVGLDYINELSVTRH